MLKDHSIFFHVQNKVVREYLPRISVIGSVQFQTYVSGNIPNFKVQRVNMASDGKKLELVKNKEKLEGSRM